MHNKSAGIPQEWELVRVHMPIVDFCRHYPDVDPKMLAKDDMDKHTSTILDALTGVFFGGMYR